MTIRNTADSKLTADEAKFMTEAFNELPERSDVKANGFKEEHDKAKSAFLSMIATSLDPCKNGYDLALEVAEFRSKKYHRILGFSNFTELCIACSLSARTISRYWKTYRYLSLNRYLKLEVFEHLTPWKIEQILKPLLPAEPIIDPLDSDYIEWAGNLVSKFEAAK